jgi:hypothetical protein
MWKQIFNETLKGLGLQAQWAKENRPAFLLKVFMFIALGIIIIYRYSK